MTEGEVLSVAEERKRKKAALKRKELKFIDAYIENGENATQAVLDAGIPVKNLNSAGVTGKYYKDKLMPMIMDKKLALIEKMDAKGLDDELVVVRHKDIIKNGSDKDALTGIRLYYDKKYTDDKTKEGDGPITINLNF
jgi:hypothetical protein